MPKILYGFYVDAHNLYSYLTVFIGLGLAGAIIQFCSENISTEKKNCIYKYSFVVGLLFNILLFGIILLLAFLKLYSNDKEVAKFLFMMSLYPFSSYIMSFFQSILRVEYKNIAFSVVNTVHAVTIFTGNLLFTYLWNIEGLIFSTYFSQCISIFVALVYLKKYKLFGIDIFKSKKLQLNAKKEINRYGIVTSITNFSSNILVLIDVTCLGFILSNPVILADYHVATVLPNACLFIPSSLILYYYPNMVKAYAKGWKDFKVYIIRLAKVFFVLAFLVAVTIFIFSPLIVRIIYGEKYLTCVPVIRVLAINFFVCAFLRKLLGNIIAVLKRYEINLVHTIVAGILNIVLNIVFIRFLGSIGAAIATLCITTFVVVMEIIYIIQFDKKQKINQD